MGFFNTRMRYSSSESLRRSFGTPTFYFNLLSKSLHFYGGRTKGQKIREKEKKKKKGKKYKREIGKRNKRKKTIIQKRTNGQRDKKTKGQKDIGTKV